MICSSVARISRKNSIPDALYKPEIDIAGTRIYNFNILKKGAICIGKGFSSPCMAHYDARQFPYP